MSKALQPVRGTHDLLPAEYAKHAQVRSRVETIAQRYGYAQMDTPIFEFSDVFHRTLGDTSDVVSKETYNFNDRGGESLTLRPEFTAGIVRSFISEGLQQYTPLRVLYHGPAFRYERPQKGRQRQFHQIGCELLGIASWHADVEMIALAHDALGALGLGAHVTLEINTLGDSDSRAAYREVLVDYLRAHAHQLSEDSTRRLEKNPLRVLDSKAEEDREIVKNAPRLSEHLNAPSRDFFARVSDGLSALGIACARNESLVRGLDYYNHTVFEFTTQMLGAQGTVLAGGRYDALVKTMGGPDTPGIGFAAGMERLVGLRDALGTQAPEPVTLDVAVIAMSEALENDALKLAHELRAADFRVEMAYSGNVGKRLKRADKLGVRVAIVLGEEEATRGEVVVKHLADGTQQTISKAALLTELGKLV